MDAPNASGVDAALATTPGGDTPPKVALIAAVARNGVIGAANAMPWRLPADLRHFRALTIGHRIVMGRKTWESLGRPLPGRENVIVSRNRKLDAPGCRVVPTLEEALCSPTLPLPVFCIGGALLYELAIPSADAIYLTEIDADFAGDTTMPPIAWNEWRESSRITGADPQTGLHYAFVHYLRIRPATTAEPIGSSFVRA